MAIRISTRWLSVAFAFCLATPALAEDSVWDPWESINRATFNLNAALAKNIAEPVTAAYQKVVPQPIQTGIDDFFTNLREPVTAISSGLQGDFQNAGLSVGRFAINSTVGIVGLFDVATDMGWVSRAEDFGATLCSYGVNPGPYFVIPILGPTNAREAVGSLASFYALSGVTGDATVNYLIYDRIAGTISTKPGSAAAPADAYAAQRDAYAAFRADVCKDGIPATQLKSSPFGSVAPKG
jgi:phospholipid-binding lipoprotein MlaA